MIRDQARMPRCLPALVVLVLGLLLIIVGLVLPWLEKNSEYTREILLHHRQLQAYDRQIASLPALQEAIATQGANRAMDVYYVDAADASLGGITLQRLVEQLVGEAGGTMTSIQILPPFQQGVLTRVGVRLRLQITSAMLQQILYGIESHEPLLFVDKLNIRSLQRRSRGRQNSQDQATQLNINLDVMAYIRGSQA